MLRHSSRRLCLVPRGPTFVVAAAMVAIAAADSPPPVVTADPASASGVARRALDAEARTAVMHDLRSLATTGAVLHIGAHPDDENTELITWLSRGRGLRTAYLSLTRGDGGQNELGKDFDEKLGVLRTQELLAARRIDGGRQFFTRAIDFGYSKSPEEALRFWDRDQVLADVVRVIRVFQPDVIVNRFPVPPGTGGHGQHTASGILAVEAFKLAGDPNAYPEQIARGLAPWQAKRVLWNAFRFNPDAPLPLDGPLFMQDIAGVDDATGEAFGTIAARSRSMHKTQGLGGFISRARTGANLQSFQLLAGDPATSDLMDGVDATWARYPGGAGIDTLVANLRAAFDPDDPAASVPAILELRARLADLPADPVVADRRTLIDRILQTCLGLNVKTTVDRAEIVPGESVTVTSHRWNQRPIQGHLVGIRYIVNGRVVEASKARRQPGVVMPPSEKTAIDTIVIPADTPLTQPYWLREDGSAGVARVDDPALIGLPESPPVVQVEFDFDIGGQGFRLVDVPAGPEGSAGGTVRIIPPVSLHFESGIRLFEPGATRPVTIQIDAARAGARGTVHLDVPPGWSAIPASREFALAGVGERTQVTFDVTGPAATGVGEVTAKAVVGGRSFSTDRVELRYDHLPPLLLQPRARARLVSAGAKTLSRQVGYLPGAGDSVAEALEQLGCSVRMLTGADLTPERLAGLDAVVLGVRAFNEREDLAEHFPGLLAWVGAGGTVVAQYNRPNNLKTAQLGPYPLSIEGQAARMRVTDETAPVVLVAPDHPALVTPNKITAADFDGWVQERGAYFPGSWDADHYVAVLSMSDPGETQPDSSLLIARHGKGYYVYTSLAFFRQLPAGVPGAWRLFANLISLGK